ncbi:hypothetical protein Tco_1329023 [Tanacetum coccineum]
MPSDSPPLTPSPIVASQPCFLPFLQTQADWDAGPTDGADVKVNLRGLLGLGKRTSVFVSILVSLAPSETTKGVCRLGLSETIAEWVFPLCLLIQLSATCHPKDNGPNQVLYPDRPVLRCCYSSYETRDSGPDLSFDIPASLEHASGLAQI